MTSPDLALFFSSHDHKFLGSVWHFGRRNMLQMEAMIEMNHKHLRRNTPSHCRFRNKDIAVCDVVPQPTIYQVSKKFKELKSAKSLVAQKKVFCVSKKVQEVEGLHPEGDLTKALCCYQCRACLGMAAGMSAWTIMQRPLDASLVSKIS